jgi:hypothetical protein
MKDEIFFQWEVTAVDNETRRIKFFCIQSLENAHEIKVRVYMKKKASDAPFFCAKAL